MNVKQTLAVAALTFAAAGTAFAGDRDVNLTRNSSGHLSGSLSVTPINGSFNDYIHFNTQELRSVSSDLSGINGVIWDSVEETGSGMNFGGNSTDKHGDSNGRDSGYYTLHVTGHLSSGHSDGEYRVQVTAVPEPETFAMLLAGLGIVGWASRRRTSRAALAV